MNNNRTSIKKEYSKISIPYYLPKKKKNSSRLHSSLFLKHGLKNLSSTEQNSNCSINKSNQNNSQYNSFIFDLNSLNKEKNILPKIEKLSFNAKTPTYNNFNYINCNSTKNVTITKSNISKISNFCNILNENNKCKIIKIIKNEKINKFLLDNSMTKRKTSLDIIQCKKCGSEKIRKTNSFQINNNNNRKKSSNISPQQKLLINCFNSKHFLLNKIYGYSRAGTLNRGKPKINQDSFIILKNIFELNFDILGIMDGHGVNGQLVSQYLKKKIISTFALKETYNLIKKNRNEIMENFIYHNLTKNNFSLIKNIINSIDKDLSKENFDSKSSGSTLLLLFHISNFIICANIGDSRCILIKKNNTLENNNINDLNNLKFENLSFDHKPNNQEEKKRIIKNGGIVRQSLNYNGIYEGCFRIYMKEKNYPGLAISRTIGDFDAKLIGTISEPDIKMKVIDDNFICVVLASDGLWDVMQGDDVIKEIYPFLEKNNFEEIAENLVNKAIFSWKAESFLRDDISTIVGVFNYKKKDKR